MESERELGMHVYSAFVDIPPTAARVLRLVLRGSASEKEYGLDVHSQPLVNLDTLRLDVTQDGVARSSNYVIRGDRRLSVEGRR